MKPHQSQKTNPRITAFIDDGNMWSVYKSIGKLIDYAKIKTFFTKKFNGTVTEIFFYKAYPKNNTRNYDLTPKHRFFTFLQKGLGFCVRKKELKTILLRDEKGNLIYDQKTGQIASNEKGNFDVEITIDALKNQNKYDSAIFMSGDSDFLPLIDILRTEYQKSVYIFSSENSVSIELKTKTDAYFDIAEYPEIHGNKLIHRNSSPQKGRAIP